MMHPSRRRQGSTWQWLWRSTVLGILTAGALTGCAGGLRPPAATLPAPPVTRTRPDAGDVAIGVLREGWHTGFVLPIGETDAPLRDLRHWFPQARYLAFGWGNRAFYTAAHRGVGTALAALLPSTSALFVHGLPTTPKSALPVDSKLRWVCASATEVSKLDIYLGYYVKKAPDGRPISIEPGPWRNSRFFASTGTYDAFHTCNTWTMAGLAFAGLPVNAKGVLFSGQVMTRTRGLPTCARPSMKRQGAAPLAQARPGSLAHATATAG